MSKRFTLICGTCCGLVVMVLAAWALAQSPQSKQKTQEEKKQDPVPEAPQRADDTQLYMRAKLASSQKVMEGLVTENFAMIRDGAIQMKRISEASHWPKTIDEVYQHHSVAFRNQCDKLADHADRRDLKAAHYTYLHMTTTCIDCHDYVRGRFTVERKKPGGPVQLIPTHWDGPVKKKKRLPPPQPDEDKSIR